MATKRKRVTKPNNEEPMRVAVTFRHIAPTQPLQSYAEKKLRRLVKLLRPPIEAHVVLSVLKHRHVAEITVMANRLVLNATEETSDLYSAIDLASAKIERQAKTHLGKRQARKYASAELLVESATNHRRGPVVTTERIPVKPMSIEEAVAELSTLRRPFFVFQNAATDVLSVVHRNKNGTYTVIEPELG